MRDPEEIKEWINDSVDLVPKTLPKVSVVTKYSVYKKYLPPYIDISVL